MYTNSSLHNITKTKSNPIIVHAKNKKCNIYTKPLFYCRLAKKKLDLFHLKIFFNDNIYL